MDDIDAFGVSVRSDMRIGKTPKRHMADVSLAVAALGLTHDVLRNDPNAAESLFESLCQHDLVIYAGRNG